MISGYQDSRIEPEHLRHTKVCDAFTIPNAFLPHECGRIIGIGLANEVISGLGMSDDGKFKADQGRRCSLSWVGRNDQTDWIFQRLESLILYGSRVYGFALCPSNRFQFTIYKGSWCNPQFYGWHFDNAAGGDRRKIAISVNLSSPKDYFGGRLKIKCHKWNGWERSKEQGSATMFPCYLRHMASPVWSGTRHSLVFWPTGPDNGGLV
jgi:predicted 2-oxoglutarate/Fe(II)-dependent dioxygenase YbiX